MKNLILAITVFAASVAFASTTLDAGDFQLNTLFDYVHVTKAEKVFSDELEGMDLYQVTYEVEGECASSGHGDVCEMVHYCEYIWVDAFSENEFGWYMEGTQLSCDISVEEVIDPQIIDEL